MPWKECNLMDERLKFIARLLDGEKMAGLCREFGISRKTGYKILGRYNETGLDGLTDRSRRPYRHANQLPLQIETQIVRLKKEKPNWGAPKIRERLARLIRMSTSRRSAPCMRCSTATTWSSTVEGAVTERRGPCSPSRASRMSFGAPTTRASSCSPIGVIVIR
jgi:transposase